MKVLKGIIIGIGFLGLASLAGLFAFIYFMGGGYPFDNREFDQSVWLSMNKDMSPDNPRGEMFVDLKDRHLKEGMTQFQIKALLGEPDFKNEPRLLSYNLGMWSGLRMDYDSLDLVFSESGKLVEAYRVQH